MKRHQIARLLPVVVYAGALAWFSLTPGAEAETGFPHADKLMHLGAYFVFVLLCLPLPRPDARIGAFVLTIILFGALLEIGQALVPLRHPSLWDGLANSLGALLGGPAVRKLRRSPAQYREFLEFKKREYYKKIHEN